MGFVEGVILFEVAGVEGGIGEGVQVRFDGAGSVDAVRVVDDALGEIELDGVGGGEVRIETGPVSVVSGVLFRSTEDSVAGEAVFDCVESRVEFAGFGDGAGRTLRIGAVGC